MDASTPSELSVRLATGLLEIAELAMPDTYFWTDSRCNLARAVLAGEPEFVGEGGTTRRSTATGLEVGSSGEGASSQNEVADE